MLIQVVANEVREVRERKGKYPRFKKGPKSRWSRRYDILKEERSGKKARREIAVRNSYLDSATIESCDYVWNRALLKA